MQRTRRLVIVALAAGLVAGGAAAQNMLSNPGFDTDVLGWLGGTFDSTRDGNGSHASGSLQLSPSGAFCTNSSQDCLPVVPGGKYSFAGQILFSRNPGANTGSGGADLGVVFLDGPCGGLAKSINLTTQLGNSGKSETWTSVAGSATAPAGALSASFFVEVCATTTDNVTANFDNLILAPVTSIPTLGGEGEIVLVAGLLLAALVGLRRARWPRAGRSAGGPPAARV